jgi:NAD(P)-dependent dehydrogenase (short-subunit alcohol dehydrogenase family)
MSRLTELALSNPTATLPLSVRIWHLDRGVVELDHGRQPDGDDLGIKIFGPLIEQHGEGGHIVSTASLAGLISGASTAYNVSKYGVVALSEGLQRELAPRGIGVSVLCPGFIRTQILTPCRSQNQTCRWY